ncbi:hypothetical protein GNZ11_17925 [Paraburkholderia xenovorans]|nr:hypothetical protein [Paraburkholderia xenovorans]
MASWRRAHVSLCPCVHSLAANMTPVRGVDAARVWKAFTRIAPRPESPQTTGTPSGVPLTRRWKRPMSTIPFTPIEGSLALPRLRPLGHVPAPFGRDWALLPPGYSLRAELKALYAAMLRTFCLSDQAIRSLCRWSPLGEQRAGAGAVAVAAQSGSAATAQAAVFAASPEAARQTAVETPVAPAVPPAVGPGPAYVTAARGYGNHWGALAGGACVLGGAAVLAWIGLDHLAHRQVATPVAGSISAHRSSQVSDLRSPVTASDLAVGSGVVNAPVTVAASAPALPRMAPTFAPASNPTSTTVSTTASAHAPAQALPAAATHISTDKTGARRYHRARETSGTQRQQNRPHITRYAAANQSSHSAVNAGDLPQIAIRSVAAGSTTRPSAAGSYSPLAPTRLGVDEYAGVTLSASTHLRDMPPSHAGSSNNASGGTATEWMSRLSQRRVTEIPDQFAK